MTSEQFTGAPRRHPRVFWLGMHHVLKPTELRRLRELGFEVFCPAYLSPLFDQSADLSVDRQQYTTLPSEVFSMRCLPTTSSIRRYHQISRIF